MKTRCIIAAAGLVALVSGTLTGADSTLKWAFFTQGVIYASPSIGADGTVCVGSQSRRIWAINPDGSLKWRYPDTLIPATDWFDASPAIAADGTVYAPNFDGRLYAIDSRGTLKWTYAIPSYFISSPAIATDGTIYVGGGDGMLHALRPDGTLAWSFATGDWVDSSPAIASDGTIYFGSWDNRLYALRPDGSLKWSFETGNAIQSSPAIGPDGTVYAGSADMKLYAVGPDGVLRWTYATGDSVDASPVVGPDGTVYFGSADGTFHAVNPDGTPAWPAPYDAGQGLFGGAVIRADGSILFGGSDRALHVLNPDGSLKWKYQTGDAVDSAPALAPDGTIYFGSYDGKLYALSGNAESTAVSSWPRFRADARLQGRVLADPALRAPAITAPPLAQSVAFGDPVTFSVQVDGTQPLTYAWIKDGVVIAGASSPTFYIAAADSGSAGIYQVRVSNAVGEATSAGAALIVAAPVPPQIAVQPRPLIVATGSRVSLWVEAAGSPPLAYQWSRDGLELPGADGPFYEIASAAESDAGSYVVRVVNAGGSVDSEPAPVAVGAAPKSRLVNLSTRARLAGDEVLIPGFVVSGSGARRLLVRAVGPTLSVLEIAHPHPDPMMRTIPQAGEGVTNDNWWAAPNAADIATTSASLGAFALPSDGLDAAVLFDATPGVYTIHVAGVTGAGGIVLVELYEGEQAGAGEASLVNISTRGNTGEGEEVMIPGFVLGGTAARTLLIRAVGPSLSVFGVTDFLPDPVLSLFDGSERVLTVDNWGESIDAATLSTVSATVGAFALEPGSADAAMLVVLMPGHYTAHAYGSGVVAGNVLVEVYVVP